MPAEIHYLPVICVNLLNSKMHPTFLYIIGVNHILIKPLRLQIVSYVIVLL
jgi:hypothetical protein